MKRWIGTMLSLLLLLLLMTLSAAAANTHGDVHHHRYDGYTIRQGIDVSEHNGKIDWQTVANSGQADFAFIRVGYRGYSSGGLYPDSRYKENLEGARMDWLDLLAVQGTLKSLLQHHSSKASILRCSAFFIWGQHTLRIR